MGMKTFRTPITIHNGKQFVAPGTEVTLDEAEANRIIGLHGEFGGPTGIKNDPGNTNVLNAMDQKSIEDLNTFASINGGHGVLANQVGRAPHEPAKGAPEKKTASELEPLPSDHELEAMKKDDLIAFAEGRGVDVANSDSKAEIIAKMKAAK